jgi:(2S)-methylsuccinyl-CoA dehydrogenase
LSEPRKPPHAAAAFDRADGILKALSDVFEIAVARTAVLCRRDGKLDPARLDEHQWLCYELAWTHAELLAARALVDEGPSGSALQSGLALAFTAEAIVSACSRLQAIYIALTEDTAALNQLTAAAELRELRQATIPAVLAELGRAVAQCPEELADVGVDEHTAMARDAFRRFAEEVVAPVAEHIHREDLTVPDSILQPLREMGVFGLSIPEEYGGSSSAAHQNTPMMIAVTEALSEASLAAAGSLITRPEILARALLTGGSEAQKTFWLPKIAAGDPLCAIAITEPDYGSDVASLSLRATPAKDGWLLNGAKTWCTFAGKAGLLMVVARTNPDRSLGHRGLSVLLVEKPPYDGHEFTFKQPAGGTLHGRAIRTVGYRGMHSFDLTFENFLVPDANIIGEQAGLGKGFYLTMAGMTGGRIQTAGRALGLMGASIKAAVQYAKDRRVFSAPLITFPLTRIKIAMMAARYAGCRHLAYAVGRRLDSGGGSIEASLAKLLACRSAEIIAREAQQIHGGMGYAEETAVSRYWLDARVLSIFEGAEETLALKVIAKGLLESAGSR